MATRHYWKLYPILLLLLAGPEAWAHPTGNLLVVGEQVLWSYISPVEDPDHKACIMSWKPGTDPIVLLQSEYPASDFMLSARGEEIYAVERRYLAAEDRFESRVLKLGPGKTAEEIWPWFPDSWHVGEAGFFMRSPDPALTHSPLRHVLVMKRAQTRGDGGCNDSRTLGLGNRFVLRRASRP